MAVLSSAFSLDGSPHTFPKKNHLLVILQLCGTVVFSDLPERHSPEFSALVWPGCVSYMSSLGNNQKGYFLRLYMVSG